MGKNKEQRSPENFSFLLKEEKEKFFKILTRPQAQCLVSNLSRGVVNTIQIIFENGDYFSHMQNFEKKSKNENFRSDIFADEIILSLIFCDDDHNADYNTLEYTIYDADHKLKHYNYNYIKETLNNKGIYKELHNVLVDFNNEKYIFFDFHKAFSEDQIISPTINDVSKKLFFYSKYPFYKEILESLINKTNLLLKNNFTEPSLFNAIIKKFNIDLDNPQFDSYFSEKNAENFKVNKKAILMFEDIKNKLKLIKKVVKNKIKNM